jgi:TrmH family RNA methyltransferase
MPAARAAQCSKILEITSRDNRWLRRFRAALREGRDETGAVGIEGMRMIGEALRGGMSPVAVLASAAALEEAGGIGITRESEAVMLVTSERMFASVSGVESPQGIAALLRPREYVFEDLLRGDVPLVAGLVGVQDPGNVGTIVRAAEAFGATGIITTRGTSRVLSPKALRASAGSALRIPFVEGLAPAIALAGLRAAGVRLCAATLREGVAPAEADFRAPCALLIGNEGAGLPPEVERSADVRIRIPARGSAESLNAAMAAAVLLYEAARQRAG